MITSHADSILIGFKAIVVSPALASVPSADLAAQITELAGHLNAANHRLLVLIAEFDRREAWGDGFMMSCAHWLNWKCGIALGAAREKVRVARALERLPLISSSMARGAISYSKVRALTRIATPETEDDLLMIALFGTAAHVERLVRGYRRAQQTAEQSREARQFDDRRLSYYFDDDGSLVLQARLPAECGAAMIVALERAMGELGCESPDVSAETSDHEDAARIVASATATASASASASASATASISQRRADALALIVESYEAHSSSTSNGGDRQQIVIHVDEQSLVSQTAGRCEIEHGPSLSAQTALRLSCDCSVVRIVEDQDGQPLDVGRKTRSIPPAIRRALRARDNGCRFPGCTHTRFLDGHHIHHWARGGHTKLSNLVMLCRFHHRMVHEGGVSIETLNDGALRFAGPGNQQLLDQEPAGGDFETLISANKELGHNIDSGTAVTRWTGEVMNYGLAVGNLLDRVERAERCHDVSAET